MKVIGVTGFARAGKDTYCTIAKNILAKNGYTSKQYSFANALKQELAPFLKEMCGVDVWTNESELKKDIRDFLVWYGTTFWRKRDPQRWIRKVDIQLKEDKDKFDFALVSDVRYPNEADWVHSHQGYLVHVEAWRWGWSDEGRELGGEQTFQEKKYFPAPNEQERTNDPIVKGQSDYKLEWEMKKLTPEDVPNDAGLQKEVLTSLNSCDWFPKTMNYQLNPLNSAEYGSAKTTYALSL